MPEITPVDNGSNLDVEVQNFGQVASDTAKIKIVYCKNGQEEQLALARIPRLIPFQKTTLKLTCGNVFEKGIEYDIKVIINPDAKKPVTLDGKITPDLFLVIHQGGGTFASRRGCR